jgi:DNA-nicking Smr family endonuclease
VVTSTVRPLKPASLPPASHPLVESVSGKAGRVRESEAAAKPAKTAPAPKHPHPGAASQRPTLPMKGRDAVPPAAVDAALHRRLTRGRDAIAARIDLHGMTQDVARVALTAFFRRAGDEGWRAILVITGKGVGGDGVLRRRVPDWLAEPPLRDHIAGVSEAHRRHGGEGALYVALKRKR